MIKVTYVTKGVVTAIRYYNCKPNPMLRDEDQGAFHWTHEELQEHFKTEPTKEASHKEKREWYNSHWALYFKLEREGKLELVPFK